MELDEAMRTQHACRYYLSEPVPDEVLARAVELAQTHPTDTGLGMPHRRRVPGPPVPAAAAPARGVRTRLRRPLRQPAQWRRGRAVNQAWSSVSHWPNVSPAASRFSVSSASLIS
jgi:nitroreductase